jgi:hypothetical protein
MGIEFDSEPQVFAAVATILMTSYEAKMPTQVTIPSERLLGRTPKIGSVKVVAA